MFHFTAFFSVHTLYIYMHASCFSLFFLSLHLKLYFLFLLFRRSVSYVWNRTVLLEKYLTCRRRWSGRIKKSRYGRWAPAVLCFIITFSLFYYSYEFSIFFACNWMPTFTSFYPLYTFLLTFFHTIPLLGPAQALERQKEYTDAIRIERDELREEVVTLKDILKVLSQCVESYFNLLWEVLGSKIETGSWFIEGICDTTICIIYGVNVWLFLCLETWNSTGTWSKHQWRHWCGRSWWVPQCRPFFTTSSRFTDNPDGGEQHAR